MHYVYILQSQQDDGYYIGCTADLQRRIAEHNNGETVSIRSRRPFTLKYYEVYSNQHEAYQREKQIKSYKGGRAFKVLLE